MRFPAGAAARTPAGRVQILAAADCLVALGGEGPGGLARGTGWTARLGCLPWAKGHLVGW